MILVHFWWTISSVTNAFYGVASGWFGDLTIVSAVVLYILHSRCHVEGCHKHGKFPFQHYKLCRVHHPDVPEHISHLHIKQLHRKGAV